MIEPYPVTLYVLKTLYVIKTYVYGVVLLAWLVAHAAHELEVMNSIPALR